MSRRLSATTEGMGAAEKALGGSRGGSRTPPPSHPHWDLGPQRIHDGEEAA